jgi:dolichyl-phosphate-mannose-protein mannosyltransferase
VPAPAEGWPLPGAARAFPARRILLALLGLELVLLAASVPAHRVHIDEAWIGEQAWMLARDGFVHSDLFGGVVHTERLMVVYHWLFVAAGAWAVRIFGWDVVTLRSVTLLAGLLVTALIASTTRRDDASGTTGGLLAAAIFVLIPVNFEHLKIYRPEMMMALFGFASFALLQRPAPDRRPWLPALAGAAAALATLTHLYGIVYVAAGGLALLATRRWRDAILFSLGAAAFLLPLLLVVADQGPLFREQLYNPLNSGKSEASLSILAASLRDEHMRLFRRPDIGFASFLFVLALVGWLFRRGAERRFLFVYTLLLIALVGLAIHDKVETRYSILVTPFFSIAIAGALWRMLARPGSAPKLFRLAFVAVAVVAGGYGLFAQARCALTHHDDMAATNHEVARRIPPGAGVVGPGNLIFDQIGNSRIYALRLADLECGDVPPAPCLAAFARRRGATYVVHTRFAWHDERLASDMESAFRLVRRTRDYEIWALVEPS